MNVDIITMGCSKNLVDSERLMRLFADQGLRVFHNPERTHGGVAVVNTCGFIEAAKQESIDAILDLCNRKETGDLKGVYVMGCLSQRYREELAQEIPQVDKFYGKFDWQQLIEDLCGTQPAANICGRRLLSTPSHYAYVKIAEGCDRHCAYCAIPLITGRHRSRTIEDIVDEVSELARNGVKEFQIIEQELTYYGVDLYGKSKIAELVERLSDVEGAEWIRLHYAYPNGFPRDLLRVMRERENVCKYLDIALQHASDNVLQRMRRHTTKAETERLLGEIRDAVPDIALRTTMMVGFPGESDEDFEELLQFVEAQRFERLGAFAYSEEEGTYAAEHYANNVPNSVKQQRLDTLMELQRSISEAHNASLVGRDLRVIIDRKEDDFYIGRTQFDSPDVDGETLISLHKPLEIGQFYTAHITSADEYDLYADII